MTSCAVGVDDEHAVGEAVERCEQPVGCPTAVAASLRAGERLSQLGVCVAPLGAHGLNRTAR